ncbi:MAG: hypothetical protein B6D44_06985 [Ignavibacteriales bacterium UTCHB2]|jgi:D-alanyl-D-alanine dipeptidase|nr:MAG: hypothetical protein B6D44_06985 [Ignavibacteriales bacterium UTCHB2]
MIITLFLMIFILLDNIYSFSFQSNPDSIRKTEEKFPLAISTQMLMVITENWETSIGYLLRYQRDKLGEKWQLVGNSFLVNIGRTGLAWGIGLHGNVLGDGPIKHEGDGKAPAGVFRLTGVFGYASLDVVSWLHMPYVQVDTCVECIDDTGSQYYNTVIDDRNVLDKNWNSSEIMKRDDDLYKFGIFVEHNNMPRFSGGGSCIFIHIWKGEGEPTAGCTSIDEENLIEILKWLDINSYPIIVQLPREKYILLKDKWSLP